MNKIIKTDKKATEFEEKVYKAVRKISKGKVSTYILVAKAIGKSRAARAVGNALNKNPYAPLVPCHRVVRSDGSVGGFAGGKEKKIEMLRKEGIEIGKEKVQDLDKYLMKLS